ncbi:MAG TPA: hypothetical protein VGA77_05230 [Propylenella sp.]
MTYGNGARYSGEERGDLYTQAGDWLVGTAKRNPEALLVLAAGCALLFRGGGAQRRFGRDDHSFEDLTFYEEEMDEMEAGEAGPGMIRSLREGVAGAAESAAGYAADAKERVYETAGSYASAAADYTEEGRRRLSRQARRLRRQAGSAGRRLGQQPLAVAAVGLAAGAALAALLPSTAVERRTLRPARDALGSAASRATEGVKEAASEVGGRLREGAAGMARDGLRDLAQDAARAFTDTVTARSGDQDASPLHRGAGESVSRTSTAGPGGSAGSGDRK